MLREALVGSGMFIGYYVIAVSLLLIIRIFLKPPKELFRKLLHMACVDLCVVTALTSMVAAPNHPVTRYIDALGCIIVACYLLYNGLDMIRKNKARSNSAGNDISEIYNEEEE
jgi:uncharacterized membrane protein